MKDRQKLRKTKIKKLEETEQNKTYKKPCQSKYIFYHNILTYTLAKDIKL